MKGDALASGQRSAQFSVAPNLKFDEGTFRDDFKKLTEDDFITKYMITPREYNLIKFSSHERVNSFVEEMKQRAEAIELELKADAKQESSLSRDCFLQPYVPIGLIGRVIVTQDVPAKPKSNIMLPKSMRKDKEYLPTTGHVIKASVFTDQGADASHLLMGVRILFSPMSGTAICFKGYPTWRQLELSEIMAIVSKEDAEVLEEELQPMV